LDLSGLDPFLVGEGSFETLRDFKRKNLSTQLTGIDTVAKLSQSFDLGEVCVREDDTKDFCSEEIVVDTDDIEKVLLAAKKSLYDIFGFVEYKASLIDTPIREKDLIMSEEDLYMIDYLKQRGIKDYFYVVTLGTLLACEDLLIDRVQFRNVDNCSMCRSFDGKTFFVKHAIQQLCSGGVLVHPYCSGVLFPVVDRFTYRGPLLDVLNVTDEKFENVPKELYKEIVSLSDDLEYKKVIFTDMSSYLSSKGLTGDKVSVGTIIFVDDGSLVVHNGWVEGKNSLDFLNSWVSGQEHKEPLEIVAIENPEFFYIRGKKVVEVEGEYFDFETGRRIQ